MTNKEYKELVRRVEELEKKTQMPLYIINNPPHYIQPSPQGPSDWPYTYSTHGST